MIKFLKNNYNLEELLELRKLIKLSYYKVKDDAYCKDGCNACKYKNSCRDLYNMYMYINQLIKNERNK